MILAASAGAWAQAPKLDAIRFGPVAVHDHLEFDYHIPIKNDPFPHEVREGYGFDGVDLGLQANWHWRGAILATELRATPGARLHFAYDQDTDFEPATDSTHGNEGLARSRSVAFRQGLQLWRSRTGARAELSLGWERQWTRYHAVTTYDLNTNPALPSTFTQRDISERAVAYELRPGMRLADQRGWGAWRIAGWAEADPLDLVLLRNYIPVVEAATSAQGYGGALGFSADRPWGAWRLSLGANAGLERGWRWREQFSRQRFTLELQVAPPKFW